MILINFLLTKTHPVLAQCAGVLGCLEPINPVYQGTAGIGKFISNILILTIGLSGIFAIFQFIIAGYLYLGAQGDPKKAEVAWWRIMYAVIGLVVIGATFMMAGVITAITGVNPLKFQILGPGP